MIDARKFLESSFHGEVGCVEDVNLIDRRGLDDRDGPATEFSAGELEVEIFAAGRGEQFAIIEPFGSD